MLKSQCHLYIRLALVTVLCSYCTSGQITEVAKDISEKVFEESEDILQKVSDDIKGISANIFDEGEDVLEKKFL